MIDYVSRSDYVQNSVGSVEFDDSTDGSWVWNITRLNSGNFRIFYHSEFYLILSSRIGSVLKIIQNYNNIGHQLEFVKIQKFTLIIIFLIFPSKMEILKFHSI